jgi:outer membrane murein-binding lipoprotein Lpp
MEKPKTQAEFNAVYGQLCAEIGDKLITIQNLNAQIEQIKGRIAELAKEAKEAAQAEAPTA